MTIRRGQMALFLAGLVLYGSALGWGLPETEPRERPDSWATDELAPAGLLEEITVDQRPVLLGGGTRCSGSLTSACTWNVPRSR